MVSASGTDANPSYVKSRACRSSWGLVLSRLTVQSDQNEVKQHPSGTAQTTERHLLLLSPPLTTFVTTKFFPSHTKTTQVSQRLSQHTGEIILAGTTLLRVLREVLAGENQCIELTQDEKGQFTIVLSPDQCCCWVSPGGICLAQRSL